MEVKVLCGCGTKFAFEVEPANGQMPVSVFCPGCNADVTGIANDDIARKLSSLPTPSALVPTVPAKTRLRVSGGHAHAPAASAPSASSTSAATSVPADDAKCTKH